MTRPLDVDAPLGERWAVIRLSQAAPAMFLAATLDLSSAHDFANTWWARREEEEAASGAVLAIAGIRAGQSNPDDWVARRDANGWIVASR